MPIFRHRCQAHAVGLGDSGGDGLLEPDLELPKGVGIELVAGKTMRHAVGAEGFGGGRHGVSKLLRKGCGMFARLLSASQRDVAMQAEVGDHPSLVVLAQ